jgi:O-methyltransferase
MTSQERIYALIQAVRYISKNNIAGDIVECGVWKGGSMMAAALTLNQLADDSRHLYLCDTFEGMTEPAEIDKDFKGDDALTTYKSSINDGSTSSWCYASLDSVKEVMAKTGYNPTKIHFVKGKVEDTIPVAAPEQISLLRLDTDWYESTRHELIHLFPRLSVGGVIIIDDYGYWQGSRMAVDEYFEQNNIKILLNRIDNAGRMGVKL